MPRAPRASQGHIHRDAAAIPDTTAAAVALTTAAATIGASSGAPDTARTTAPRVDRHNRRRSHRRPTVRQWDWKPGNVRVGYAVGSHALVVSHVVLPLHRVPP